MRKLLPFFLAIMLLMSMVPVFALSTSLTTDDFKPSRKLLVEMFLEPE